MSFRPSSKLKEHRRRHIGERPFVCDECVAAFSQACNLKRHKRIHTLSRLKPFVCAECDTAFRFSNQLRKHLKIHSEDAPFFCEVCEATLRCYSELKDHVRIHTGQKPFTCSECSAAFRITSHLKRHTLSRRAHIADTLSAALKKDELSLSNASYQLRSKRFAHEDKYAGSESKAGFNCESETSFCNDGG